MVILFVDMLGVRSRWHEGGRDAAEAAFQAFRNLIAYSLRGAPPSQVIRGVVETDAAAITCSSVDVALDIGRRLYLATFQQTERNLDNRYWLRGVIAPLTSDRPLRTETHFAASISQVDIVIYDQELLDAIQVEKSGIKGMRLLVDRTLVTPELNRQLAITVGTFKFIPIKRLRNSSYPGKVADGYLDYFWMASGNEDTSTRFDRLMALRLRHASKKSEEFAQAAATQVLFHECAAIIGSLRTRQYWQQQKVKRKSGQTDNDPTSLEMVVLSDGTVARVGDSLYETKGELGQIVSIHHSFIYLSTTDGIHRKVRTDSVLFQTLKSDN
ncbi:MAG: hypothetical protein H7A43_11820 [Verrucomicrobia bacterium]|nr:hypothetical protein [Verrucomicrobiota bacterium]